MDINSINVRSIIPEKKDYERAEGLQYQRGTWYGSGAPFQSEAAKMAKLIKDPNKLVRRSIAVLIRWGTNDHIGYDCGCQKTENAWKPFSTRLTEMGFTWQQISDIIDHAREIEANVR